MDYTGLLTTTAQSLTPYVVDGLHNGSITVARFMTDPVPWDEGVYYQQPIQVSENDNGGPFVGMPQFDVSADNNDRNLRWLSKGERQSVVVPWSEVAHNKTKAGVIKLVGRKMDIAKNAMKNRLGSELLGIGSGDAMEGLDIQTDNSSLTATYGDLPRSTFGQVINGQSNTVTTLNLSALSTQIDACTPANSEEGTTMMLGTKTIYALVEQLLDAKATFNYERVPMYITPYTPNGGAVKSSARGGASGFTSIFHRGIPLAKDEKVASGRLYFLNENMQDFASLAFPNMQPITLSNEVTKGVYDGEPAPSAFQATEKMVPYNQLGDILHMIAYGNFINRNPVRSGVIKGIVGV